MFEKPTVFVLGAGASWHYGYPTGEDLVPLVINKADELGQFFKGGGDEWSGNLPDYALRKSGERPFTEEHWRMAQIEAEQLSSRLKRVNPVLIDYFLAQNPALHDIGRLAIALVIFDCEHEFHTEGGNPNHLRKHYRMLRQGQPSNLPEVAAFNDDWLRFVLHQMTRDCGSVKELDEKNDLVFLTFNYDMSLEKRLYDGLSGIGIYRPEEIGDFVAGRVVHVYGGVREKVDEAWRTHSIGLPGSASHGGFLASVSGLNLAYKASQGILTIDGPDKSRNSDALKVAQTAINHAEYVYILGYGFDAFNNARIGLEQLQPKNSPSFRRIYFTNYGDTAKVSRAAGRLLAQSDELFALQNVVSPDTFVGNLVRRTRCEMSAKDVYGALSGDFELAQA